MAADHSTIPHGPAALRAEATGSPRDPLLGAQVGAYHLIRQIGEGGMGTVYEARHTELGQRAAVKVLRQQHSDDPRSLQRFLNEARALAVVQHPGLIRLYDHGALPDGTAYILMELLEGVPLSDRIAALRQRGQRMELAGVRDLVVELAQTLAVTHERGIVHRDLKPDNIFLCPDPAAARGERSKILDFGIAKFLSGDAGHKTTVGLILGTPIYMAPEQCEGSEDLSDRVDVYSLGVILYELCAGQPPFVADTGATVMRQHMFRPPPPLPAEIPAPPALASLLAVLLAKAPEDRPAMTEVAQRLKAMDLGAVRRARPSRPALLVAAALLCGGTALLLWLALAATQARRQARATPSRAPLARPAAPAANPRPALLRPAQDAAQKAPAALPPAPPALTTANPPAVKKDLRPRIVRLRGDGPDAGPAPAPRPATRVLEGRPAAAPATGGDDPVFR